MKNDQKTEIKVFRQPESTAQYKGEKCKMKQPVGNQHSFVIYVHMPEKGKKDNRHQHNRNKGYENNSISRKYPVVAVGENFKCTRIGQNPDSGKKSENAEVNTDFIDILRLICIFVHENSVDRYNDADYQVNYK